MPDEKKADVEKKAPAAAPAVESDGGVDPYEANGAPDAGLHGNADY